LENELATNLGITRDFVWAEEHKDVRAPPKVARSDMRLAEIAEMSLEQVGGREGGWVGGTVHFPAACVP